MTSSCLNQTLQGKPFPLFREDDDLEWRQTTGTRACVCNIVALKVPDARDGSAIASKKEQERAHKAGYEMLAGYRCS
jgi:hypothetical protein